MAKKKPIEVQEDIEEQIIDIEYSDVMRKSYIDYAMSVIVSRAIPDIRDGLKPVQRRIIYDMDELGIYHDKPYRKSARITGDTMGKYHPHGDSSIYEALVVMSQDFKKSVPLVDGHGNFGSIEGDGAAAQRYTEAKLRAFTEEVFLKNLKYDTVDFSPNYDESEKEPQILPSILPNFLINGSEGIAVGMTTSTPPHNVSDVIDTIIYFLEHSKCTNEDLLNVLKGPDFPTGGFIANKSDLLSIYETGTGKLKLRGKIEFEQGKGSEKDKLVITEIPYTMIGDGISKLLQTIADLVENRTLPEIVDITNQTSKDGIRIVLELKKGTDCKYIENMLYKKTRLEDTFGVNMLAVSKGKPEVLSLKDVLQAYIEFQYEIYTRKFNNLLDKTKKRIEVLEGLIRATNSIDLIIEILRGSKSIKQAKDCLMNGNTKDIKFKTKTSEKQASKLDFTEVQADAILAMQLSRLVGLEIDALNDELSKKKLEEQQYTKILSNNNELKKEIKKELKSLKTKYGVERRTQIIDAKPIEIVEKEEEEIKMVVLVDKFYYMHSVDESIYNKNIENITNDDYRYIIPMTNKEKLVVFTDIGKAHILKGQDIPFGKLRDKGQPIDNICNYSSAKENIIGISAISNPTQKQVFVSSNGFVKIVDMSEFDVTRKTVDATKFKDNATLLSVLDYEPSGYLTLGTKNGLFIRFKQEEIPEQKKTSVGVIGIRMADEDTIMYSKSSSNTSDLISIEDKLVEIGKIKMMKRGGRGTKSKI